MFSLALFFGGLVTGVAIGVYGLAFWVEMLDPSVPGDGLEKHRDE